MPSPSPAAVLVHPLTHILLSVIFNAASQVLLRVGASEAGQQGWVGFHGLASFWIWAGIAAQIASLASWLHALRTVKLLIAFNLSGLLHVLVPLASWLVLGERIPAARWLGIALVLAGVLIVAAPAAAVETRMEKRR